MSSQDHLRVYSRTTPRIITVDVRNYAYDSGDSIHVDCCGYCFVLSRENLALLGFAATPDSELTISEDAMFVDNLGKYYSFLEVVKEFIQGKRGDYIPDETSKEELHIVLSPYLLDYCKFVTLSMSNAQSKQVRVALDNLIGKIVVDFSKRTLEMVLEMRGNLTLSQFLLQSLREC